MKKLFKQIFIFFVCLSMGITSFAQENVEEKPKFGPRKQMAKIVFAGLGGSVLGLSTLSFYGRPQDHLSNIAIGFAVGIIVGTVYTTYDAAKKPPQYTRLEPKYLSQSSRKVFFEKPLPTAQILNLSF